MKTKMRFAIDDLFDVKKFELTGGEAYIDLVSNVPDEILMDQPVYHEPQVVTYNSHGECLWCGVSLPVMAGSRSSYNIGLKHSFELPDNKKYYLRLESTTGHIQSGISMWYVFSRPIRVDTECYHHLVVKSDSDIEPYGETFYLTGTIYPNEKSKLCRLNVTYDDKKCDYDYENFPNHFSENVSLDYIQSEINGDSNKTRQFIAQGPATIEITEFIEIAVHHHVNWPFPFPIPSYTPIADCKSIITFNNLKCRTMTF